MSAKLPWFDRRWNFTDPVEKYPDVLERLRGTPARVEELAGGVATDVLMRREREGTWSIQENVGHLIDLDLLHMGRVDDYLSGRADLRAADLTNRLTHTANHHARPLAELFKDFRAERMRFVARLETLSPADFARTATHPRLKVPMRMVDMCTFTADHDDYHLARIRELMRMLAD